MIMAYEKLKAHVEEFTTTRKKLSDDRDAAVAAVQVVRRQLSDTVKLAAGDSSMTGKVVETQASVVISEEKLRQAEEALRNVPSKPAGVDNAYSDVRRSIDLAIRDGSLFAAEFQPTLQDLAKLKSAYLEKLGELLTMQQRVNGELGRIQSDAQQIQREYTGDFTYGAFNGLRLVETGDFRPHIWIREDYQNQFCEVERKLAAPPHPFVSRDVIVQNG
jgi:hypothetical protein